jgi:hypothetical protein
MELKYVPPFSAINKPLDVALWDAYTQVKNGAKRYDTMGRNETEAIVTVSAYRVHDIIRIDVKSTKNKKALDKH